MARTNSPRRHRARGDSPAAPPAPPAARPNPFDDFTAQPTAPPTPTRAPVRKCRAVTIKVPAMRPLPGVHIMRHLEIRVNQAAGIGLRHLYDALMHDGATLASGRKVRKPVDAARWLLEKLGDAVAE